MPAQAIKAMIGKVQATQPLTMASEPVSIFFSYSRKDEALMRELESHLEPLRLSRLIESWHDGCITPGEEWEPQIKENLQKAQIILLLISVNFISSKYCNTVELTQAIKRHKSGDALVIPLILKPCMWQPIPVGQMTLGELQALPKDAKPVTSWNDPDEAYTNIAEGLYEKILQVQQELEQAEYAANLKTYEQEFARAVQAEYPLSLQVIDELKSVQQRLGLTDEEISPIEQPIREPAEAKYQQALAEAERQRQEAEAALRRQREQEEAERQRREAEAQRQREEAERQQKRDDYYNGGIYHLEQGNLDQAIADLTQAKQLGHQEAAQMLEESGQLRQVSEAEQFKQATENEVNEYFSSGLYFLDQENYDQAISDFTRAERLGHPDAPQILAKAKHMQQEQALELQQKALKSPPRRPSLVSRPRRPSRSGSFSETQNFDDNTSLEKVDDHCQTINSEVSGHPAIAPPSKPMEYRAIGLVRGTYQPTEDQLTRGALTTEDGAVIDAVLLGRVTSLVKKHIDLTSSHLWVVYPRTRRTDDGSEQDLHLQIVGVWEPETLDLPGEALHSRQADEKDTEPETVETDEAVVDQESSQSAPVELPQVNDNFFSIRGEVVKYSPEEQLISVKIRQGLERSPGSSKPFKVNLKGNLEGRTVGYFWDFKAKQEDQLLVLEDASVVGIVPPKKNRAKKKPGGWSKLSRRESGRPMPSRQASEPRDSNRPRKVDAGKDVET